MNCSKNLIAVKLITLADQAYLNDSVNRETVAI